MPNAYETWRETKRLLEDESVTDEQDAYYQAVLDSLQPKALHAYLTEFVASNFNYTEEVADIEVGDIPEFLAGLDDLRGPSLREQNNLRAELILVANKALDKLALKNWTADNTYGEAIEDIRTVLKYVLAGSPFPDLERFRCPSRHLLSDSKGNLTSEVRCDLQLPHAGAHIHQFNQYKHAAWTDEQALNPPKDNDAPTEQMEGWCDEPRRDRGQG